MVREFDRATGVGLFVTVDLANFPSPAVEQSLSFLAALTREWAANQDGRLIIALSCANGWQQLILGHRRQATEVLKALAEWPEFESGQPQLWNPLTIIDRMSVLRIRKPSGASDELTFDPTVNSPVYRQAESNHD